MYFFHNRKIITYYARILEHSLLFFSIIKLKNVLFSDNNGSFERVCYQNDFPVVYRHSCVDAFVHLLLFSGKTFNRGKTIMYFIVIHTKQKSYFSEHQFSIWRI